ARARGVDGHGPRGGSPQASRDRLTRGGDKSASRCPRSGGGGSLAAWDRAVAGALAGSRRSLAHPGHREACSADPRTLWGQENACALASWAWLASAGGGRLAWGRLDATLSK